jgi:nicotinamide-nucleotide amidase
MPTTPPTDAELLDLARELGQRLLRARLRLVTAESCTAGWIAKAMTDLAGSSGWFECGYVVYSNAAKIRDLGVALATLAAQGAVSEATVREMAEGALRVSGAEVAVAVSGIAGPDGGTADKPVGTVWICAGVQRAPRGASAERDVAACDTDDARDAGGRGGEQRLAESFALVSKAECFPGDRDSVRRLSVASALRLVLSLDLAGGVP